MCYSYRMNARLKDILERVEKWPEGAQEHVIELLLSLEREYAEPYELSDADKAAIDRSLADARHERFASEAEVEELFRRSRPK